MTNLIETATHRARTMMMVLCFILIAGSLAYVSIPKEAAPDIKVPIIYVAMTLEGVSPEDAERLLIRPMEKKLKSIPNVKQINSEAQEGFASVMLEFQAGFDSDRALADVRSKADEAKAELPEDTEEPTVSEVNFSMFPVVNVILTGDVPERVLMTIARDLRDKIEGLSAVLEAKLAGDREEVLEIIVDPLTFEDYQINPADVLQRVRANNQLIAAGEMDTGSGRYGIKLPGLIENFRDLMNIVLLNNENTSVTLSDVAKVRRTFKDRANYARINGHPAIGIGVSKRSGANIIDTVQAIRTMVAEEKRYWPAGVDVVFSQDTSNEIITRVSDLENSVILAVLLVFVVVMMFMGARAAGMVAFAIPGSFLIGILWIAVFGMTLNIVVLFSLILSVGMLVDSAIVVSEYADTQMAEGVDGKQAYAEAAKRMAWPIIASTITTLVVFMPLLFWPGIVGQFMKYMPLTLIVTLTGSLLMALLFIPVIGKLWFAWRGQSVQQTSNARPAEAQQGGFTNGYAQLLERVLGMPRLFALSIVLFVAVIIASFGLFGKGVEFFPNVEPSNANLIVRARGNLSVEEMDSSMRKVEALVTQKFADEVKTFYTQSGKVSVRDVAEDTIGVLQLELADWDRRRKADVILADMVQTVEQAEDIKGITIETATQKKGPPRGKDIHIEFSSRFPEAIAPAVQQFKAAMKELGDFRNIEDDLPVPKIEWEFRVNRELAGRNNISVAEIGQMIRLVSNGVKVNGYRPDDADDEIDIVVRFPKENRQLSQLSKLKIQTAEGQVPMSNFVTRVPKQSIGTIRRVDGVRVHNVKADLTKGVLADNKLKEITAWLQTAEIDPRVRVTFRGEDEDQNEAKTFLVGAFLTALFAMSLILVTQFNSLYRMVVIMSAVFLSIGGVMLGMLVAGKPFGIVMSGVGVISLAGIVVNNNIIFIDTYQILRDKGIQVREALVETGRQRLRPILLTAGTTVLGLLPMVIGMNLNFLNRTVSFGSPSSQWWEQLSTAIAGGLTFATVLTLFLTPCLLLLWEGRKEKKG